MVPAGFTGKEENVSGFASGEKFLVNDRISIGMDVVGGGDPGKAYADNSFIYRVLDDGKVILFGDDLKSVAVAKTTAEMARMLAESLVSYAEDPEQMSTLMPFQAEWLENNADALSAFAMGGVPESEADLKLAAREAGLLRGTEHAAYVAAYGGELDESPTVPDRFSLVATYYAAAFEEGTGR